MTWTDRYLGAVLRSIPEPKRSDVEQELRSSIEDGIEERIEAGEDRPAAEREVLEALGDPAQLAAAYTGQPSYLVGPELFPLYRQFLPRLLATAVPIAGIVMLLVKLGGSGNPYEALAAGIGGAINVAIQIVFWSTTVFAFLEWFGPARQARSELVAATGRWTLERLPKVVSTRISASETAGEVVTVLITIGVIAFLAALRTTDPSGVDVPLLHSTFTSIWLPILLLLVALRGIAHVRAYKAGGWTTSLVVYHALVHVTFAIPVVVVAMANELINPRFAELLGLSAGVQLLMLAVAIGTILATGWEIYRVMVRARRAGGAAPQLDTSLRSA
jgi:hypothetical protein